MKTMLALVLLVACASQAYSSCTHGGGVIIRSEYPASKPVAHPYYYPYKGYHPTVERHCTCGSCDGCQYKKPSCVERVCPHPVHPHPVQSHSVQLHPVPPHPVYSHPHHVHYAY